MRTLCSRLRSSTRQLEYSFESPEDGEGGRLSVTMVIPLTKVTDNQNGSYSLF